MNVMVDRYIVLPITFLTSGGDYATLDPSTNINVEITHLPNFVNADDATMVASYSLYNPISDPHVCILSFLASKRGIYFIKVSYTGGESLSEPNIKYFTITCGNDYEAPVKHTYQYNPLTGNIAEIHSDYYRARTGDETVFHTKVVGFTYEAESGEARLSEVEDRNES